VAGSESHHISIDQADLDQSICISNNALGNGVMDNIHDIIYVDPDELDLSKSLQIASEVEEMNQICLKEKTPYILLGFGRWGTADPWLGIPVNWYQVSQARVIVESYMNDLKVEPSQGSHFFHNLISLRLGYFYIKDHPHNDFIDWQWIKARRPHRKTKFLRHLKFRKPFIVKIDGKISKGIIYKPDGYAK
jgi:hypothetical protein